MVTARLLDTFLAAATATIAVVTVHLYLDAEVDDDASDISYPLFSRWLDHQSSSRLHPG